MKKEDILRQKTISNDLKQFYIRSRELGTSTFTRDWEDSGKLHVRIHTARTVYGIHTGRVTDGVEKNKKKSVLLKLFRRAHITNIAIRGLPADAYEIHAARHR